MIKFCLSQCFGAKRWLSKSDPSTFLIFSFWAFFSDSVFLYYNTQLLKNVQIVTKCEFAMQNNVAFHGLLLIYTCISIQYFFFLFYDDNLWVMTCVYRLHFKWLFIAVIVTMCNLLVLIHSMNDYRFTTCCIFIYSIFITNSRCIFR
jgi:hypothetical protein